MDLALLKKAKKEQRLTLQQISDMSGVPKRTVDDIFSGHTANPRIDTLCAIERALGLRKEKENNEAVLLTDKQQRLLSAFDKLVPAMQDNVIGIVENLAEQTAKRGVS